MKIKQGLLDALLDLHALANSLPVHPTTDQMHKLAIACGQANYWVNDMKDERMHQVVEVAE